MPSAEEQQIFEKIKARIEELRREDSEALARGKQERENWRHKQSQTKISDYPGE